VPRERKPVHALLDVSFLVDDGDVIGDKKVEKLLLSLISVQRVNWETLAAIMLKILLTPA
jgi:hypothetical protein